MTFIVESSEKPAAKCVVLSIDDFVKSKIPIFIWTQCIENDFFTGFVGVQDT
jgi:hypothetical protein